MTRFQEFNNRSGKRIIVMPDKIHNGKWASGFAPDDVSKMKFIGGFDSYSDAYSNARQRYRDYRKKKRE